MVEAFQSGTYPAEMDAACWGFASVLLADRLLASRPTTSAGASTDKCERELRACDAAAFG